MRSYLDLLQDDIQTIGRLDEANVLDNIVMLYLVSS